MDGCWKSSAHSSNGALWRGEKHRLRLMQVAPAFTRCRCQHLPSGYAGAFCGCPSCVDFAAWTFRQIVGVPVVAGVPVVSLTFGTRKWVSRLPLPFGQWVGAESTLTCCRGKVSQPGRPDSLWVSQLCFAGKRRFRPIRIAYESSRRRIRQSGDLGANCGCPGSAVPDPRLLLEECCSSPYIGIGSNLVSGNFSIDSR